MPELYFDEGSISRAIERAVGTGAAAGFGEAVARAFTEALEPKVEVRPSRDRLAAMAMQGLAGQLMAEGWQVSDVAKDAYAIADAMLSEAASGSAPTPASSTAIRAALDVMRDAAERIFNGTADQGTSEDLTGAASLLEKGT